MEENEKRNDSQIQDKHIEKAQIKGKVSRKKKKSKFAELFFKNDLEQVSGYIFSDVIIPSVIELIRNAFNNAFDMTFYGESRSRDRSRRSRASHISYNNYYDDRDDRDYRRRERDRDRDRDRGRHHFDYEDIEYYDRADALDVVRTVREINSAYDITTINDVYDSIPPKILEELEIHPDFTDEKYGWRKGELRDIYEERTFGGKWVIRFPKASPLN